ncbi:MAG TPA: VWA domain-containing protein [Longimicrobiaceae bacterium]
MTTTMDDERLRRWRLILGGGQADGTGLGAGLDQRSLGMDRALGALYDSDRKGGLGSSSPSVARWMDDVRQYFPSSVVRVIQKDALERLDLRQMLMEPELLETIVPDVHLVASLVSLSQVMPARTRDTARQVVRRVVDEVQKRLAEPMRQAVRGALNRGQRNLRPRHSEIDWHRTIRANLRHYQPELKTIVPETRIGFGRRRAALRDVVLCIDQSGSMAASAVYSGIFGSVLASLPAVKTHVVAFDTAVVDLSAELHDPVELLFGIQLGGGTDIDRALAYCQTLVTRPRDTVFVLVSDLFEGGPRERLLARAAELARAGVQMIALLALSDDGVPAYDHDLAASLAALGVPAFACTPDRFPDLMAAAIDRRDPRAAADGDLPAG